jgi:hypothetical protein
VGKTPSPAHREVPVADPGLRTVFSPGTSVPADCDVQGGEIRIDLSWMIAHEIGHTMGKTHTIWEGQELEWRTPSAERCGIAYQSQQIVAIRGRQRTASGGAASLVCVRTQYCSVHANRLRGQRVSLVDLNETVTGLLPEGRLIVHCRGTLTQPMLVPVRYPLACAYPTP